MKEPTITATTYTVSSLDLDHPELQLWSIAVEWAGRGWAVRWMGRCWNVHGVEDWEPIPSERDDAWLREYRFPDLLDALRIARDVALPQIKVNGLSVDDVVARGRWWER